MSEKRKKKNSLEASRKWRNKKERELVWDERERERETERDRDREKKNEMERDCSR